MYSFKIKIAGLVFQLETIHVRTYAICRDFIVECELPDHTIIMSQKDIDNEKERYSNKEYELWDGLLEVNAVLRKISDYVVDKDIFLMHGTVVSVNNEAYLFTAPSGTGKTTHCVKWVRNSPDARIINGDKPFIITYPDGERPLVCGSPWAGKESIYVNTMVPLKAVIILERGTNNVITKTSFSDAFPSVLRQIHRPDDETKMRKTIKLVQRLYSGVQFWRFQCNNFKEDSFDVAYNALVRGIG